MEKHIILLIYSRIMKSAICWFFSIVNVIASLTDSNIPERYWIDLKTKLVNEGSEMYKKIIRLKLKVSDEKNERKRYIGY